MMDHLMGLLRAAGADGPDADPELQAAMFAQLEEQMAEAGRRADGEVPGNFPGATTLDDDNDEEGDRDPNETQEDAQARARARRQGEGTRGMIDFFRGLWGNQGQDPGPGQAGAQPEASASMQSENQAPPVLQDDDDDIVDESDGEEQPVR